MKSELQRELNNNIPAGAVEQREAFRGGPKLSYLSGAYVINRLNEVLGQGNWGYSLKALNKVYEGTIAQSSGEVFTTSYVATVGFWAVIDSKGASFDEVGYGDGTDKKSPGKAHELATKEALTDGIKRAAKNLGISLGLGLYFKSGEYIDDEVTTKPVAKQEVKQVTQTVVQESKNITTDGGSSDTPEPIKEGRTARAQRQSIKSFFSVLKAKGVIDESSFKVKYLGNRKVDELKDDEVSGTLAKVKLDFKEALSL